MKTINIFFKRKNPQTGEWEISKRPLQYPAGAVLRAGDRIMLNKVQYTVDKVECNLLKHSEIKNVVVIKTLEIGEFLKKSLSKKVINNDEKENVADAAADSDGVAKSMGRGRRIAGIFGFGRRKASN